jgi:hypothetical protein
VKIALIVSALLLGSAEAAQACPNPFDSPAAQTCEYMNFVVLSDFPGYEHAEGLANAAILKQTEDVFSRELELAGFHRVRNGETPWLFLRAILQSSSLRSDAVSGIIELGPRSNLHRDLAMAPGAGSHAASDIGMVAVIEASTGSTNNEFGATAKLRELARANAQWVRDNSYPVLSELCKWRTELLLDGLTPADLRQRLVDGVDRIRRVHREDQQRKSLKLELEP